MCFLSVHLTIKISVYLFLTIRRRIKNTGSFINLKPPPNLSLLFNQFSDSALSLSLCISLFHLNTYSLNKDFDDLQYLVKTKNQTFHVIAISQSKIKSNIDITTNINLPNYSIECTLPKLPNQGRT